MSPDPDLGPPDLTEGPRFRRGRLLVASPTLIDPNFAGTVVLMLEHSSEGALGLVLNRPTRLSAGDAMPRELATMVGTDAAIHQGGPVQPEAVIVLADYFLPEEAGALVVHTVGIVDPQAVDAALNLRRARAFGGYAGWGADQLEGEIREGAWIDAECEPDDVFTDDAGGLWRRVLVRKGGVWAVVGQLPEEPHLN